MQPSSSPASGSLGDEMGAGRQGPGLIRSSLCEEAAEKFLVGWPQASGRATKPSHMELPTRVT